MQKSKNTGKFYRLFSIVRRTMAFVRIGRKYDRLTKKYPPLLTMQQTAELLDVHPNTLRAWDKQKKLRAVRIGVRKDRRYQRSDVVRLFERTQQISWPGQTLQRLRPFITLRTSFGLLAALLLISWAPKPFVHAEPSEDTISMRPAICRGWTTPDGALKGSDVPAADTSDMPAAHLTINDIAVTAGLGSLNNIQQDFGCDDFSVPVDQSTVKLKSVRLVWNQAVIGTPNSLDVVRVEVRREGQKTSPVVLTPLNERSSGEKSAEMTGNWTFSDLQRASIHALVDIGSAEPFSVAINNPHFEVLVDRITPPKLDLKIDQKKFAKTSKTLDALVEFSKSAYATNEQPVVTVPKHETKKILFITAKKVDWTLDTVSIVDANNKPVTPKYATHDVTRGEETDTTINLQTAGFHPGKYTVKIKMKNSDGNDAVVEKTFFWGVVAVNFTRAAPQPHEVETVGIGVLDDKGRTICNADITVKIKDPRGKTFTFLTKKRSITLNPNCVDKNVTNEPDYHFNFTPHLVGTYHLTLKAKTEFGERTYEDNLIVASSQIFDVQRIDYPTRINPYAAYKVRIAITPRRDFTGVVYESVPSNFKVSQFQPAATVQDDPAHQGMKRIGWEVQWKKDATYYVGYKFVAPPISPALFQTGPLSIGGNDLLGADFSEPRQWQIASDSISSISWDGSASALWSNPANWSTNAIPQPGDTLVFPAGAANYSNTNDLPDNTWFNNITFYDSGYTLAGNAIILGQGRATPAIILPGITDAVSSGGNTISLPLRFDATQIITVTNSSEILTISGAITGAGGVTKEGLGELIFSGGNKYGGVTKVNVGSLNVQHATGLGTIAAGTEVVGEAALEIQGNIDIDREALTLRGYGQSSSGALRNISGTNSFSGLITIAGTTNIASDSGTLTLNGGVSGTFNLNLDGAGNITFAKAPIAIATGLLTKNGGGTVTYNFPNTYTGLTTVNAGTLTYGVDNAILSGGITVNGGTVDIATFSDMVGTVTLGTLMGASGTITGTTGVLSSATYTLNAGTISAIIAGDVAEASTQVTKQTPGTVTLSGANQFTGATTISVGVLKIQHSSALGTIDGSTTISSGATLQIDGTGLSIPEFITASGIGFLNQGAILNTTGNNTMTGLITLAAASSIEIATSTSLTFSDKGFTGAFGLTFDCTGDAVVSAPIATTTGTLTKDGPGDLTLSAYNPFTGATTVNFGNLILNGNGSIAMSASVNIKSGAKLEIDNSTTVTDRVGDASAVTMNGGDLDFYGNSSVSTMATMGALTLASGQNTISVFAAAGGSTILRFASLTRTAGAMGLFRGTSLGATPAANVATILFTTAPTLLGDDGEAGTPTVSILQGFFGDNSTSGTGTDMVTYGRGNNNGIRLLNGAGFSNEYTTDYLVTNANVKVTSGSAAVTSQINSLILGSGASITNPGSAQTITFTSGNILNLQTSGSIAGANTTLAAGSTEFTIRTPQDLDISSLITTTGGLSKAGTGTLTFSTSKTYTGTTNINAGTLLYGSDNAISSGAVTINDATLDIATYSDTVGAVIVQGGTLTGTSGILTATSYDFRAATISAIIGGTGTTTISNTNERVDAVTVMSRDNTYTGTTSIASGVLKLGAAGGGTNTPLGTTAGSTSITNGAMLDLNGFSLGTAEAINTFRGTGIAGEGAIINSSATAVTYSGNLTIATSARIGANYGKITISGTISGTGLPLTVGGLGDIDITGAIQTGASGSVIKDGFGTYTPSGNNTYTGATTITAGAIKLGGVGDGTNSPLGTAATATTISTASTSGAGYLDLNGQNLTIAEPLTINGLGTGTGDFASGAVKNSSASNVTYTGTATLGSSSMIVATSGAINFTSTSATAGTGFTLTLGGSGGGTLTGAFTGGTSGAITKIDSGTWKLSGDSTYTGATTIYQGTIQLGATGGATNTPLGTTGAGTTIYSGGVLDLNGFTLGTLETFTLNGFGIANSGCVVNNSASGVNFSGARTLSSDIRITNSGAGTLTWSGASSGVFETQIAGAGNHTLSGAWAATAAIVRKEGAGTASATVAQGWTGNTYVFAGTLQDGVLNGLSSGNVIIAGGTFDLSVNNTDTVGGIYLIDGTLATSGGGSAVLTGTSYTVESGTISGVIAGAIAITKNTAGTASITGAITSSGALTINAGSVTLSGTSGSAANITAVTINPSGLLAVDNTSANNTARLSDSLVLTMNDGNFSYTGSSSTNASETISQLAAATGHNVVTVNSGSGGSTTLTFGGATGFNRTVGATVLFRGPSFGSTPAANVSTVMFTNAPTLTGAAGSSGSTTISVLKGAFGDNSTTGTGTDMVTYNVGNTNGLRLLNGPGFSGEYASNFGTNNANVKLTADTTASAQNVNSLVLSGGGVTNPGTAQTLTMAGASLSGNILIDTAHDIAGANTTLGITTYELDILATADATISAVIGTAASGSLAVTGDGTISLSAANAYTGTTFITDATVQYLASNVLSSGGVTIVDGYLDLNGYSDTIGAVSLNYGTITTGAGTLTLGGTVTSLGSAKGSSSISGALGLGANRIFDVADGQVENDLTISAAMSGAYTVTKSTGTGVLVLSGNSSYTGSTTVSTGTLRLGAAGNGTDTPTGTSAGGISVSSGATFDLQGYSLSTTEAITTNGSGISNSGVIQNSVATAATYQGLLTISGSTLIASNYGDINLTNSGTVTGAGIALTLNGSGNGAFSSVLGTTTGTLTKSGVGTWTISANSTYTGATTISSGVLKLGAAGNGTNTPFGTSAGGVSITSGAVLDLNGYTLGTSEALTINGTGIASSGAVTTSSGNATSWGGSVAMGAASRITNYGSGAFSINGNITGNFALTPVASPGNINQGSGSVWSGTGTLVKEGSGTTTLAGQNSMTGAMTVSTGTLQLGAAGGATNTPLGTNAGGVTVAAGAVLDLNTFALGGASTYETLNLSGTGIKNGGVLTSSASSGSNFGATTIAANARIINNGSGTITMAGTITIANAIKLSIGGSGQTTISGAFGATATTATLTKWDSGTLVLSGTNPTTGIYRVNGGTMRISAATTLATAPVTVAGGTFDMNGVTDSVGAIIVISGTLTDSNGTPGALTGTAYTFYSGAISGVLGGTSIAMAKNSGGTLTANKSLTNTGTLTVNAGSFQYLASDVLSNSSAVSVAGGSLDMGTNSDTVAAVTLSAGSITSSTGVLTGASYAVQAGSISAILAGAVNLTKSTTGTVTLSGTNTYTGITTISAGTLSVGTIGNGGVAGNLGQATNSAANLVSSTATGTLQYTGSTASTDRNVTTSTGITLNIDITNPSAALTLAGATTSTTAPITKVGLGTLKISGTNLHTGTTSVLSGTLQYLATNSLSTGGVTVTNGILDMNGYTDSVGTVTLTNGGQIIDSAGSAGVLTSTATYALQSGFVSAKLGSAVASGISKTTTDRVFLSGDNPYTSTSIALSAGKLRLRHNNALGASGTTLATTVTAGAMLEIDNGITTPTTKTLTLNGTGVNTQGALLNVSGTNTIQGAITLGATGVRINAASDTLTMSGTMTGAGFAVTFGGAGNLTYSGAINTSTSGTVTKDGTGTLTISNANNYTGATTISAGVVAISNATAFGTTAGGVTVATGAAIQISNTITVGAEALTLNGSGVSNTGAIRNTSGTNTWQGTVTLSSTSYVGSDSGSLAFSGSITGSGSIGLTKVGAGTVTIATTTLGGDLTISAGTLAASGTVTISVGGSWSNSGTFTASTSTVAFTSTNTATITGDTTFNNFSVTGIGAAKTLSFVHGSTTTVAGTWTVTGASGQLVTLTRDATSNWNVNPTTVSIDYVDVSYSTNLGSTICATHSISTNGNNTGWNVTAAAACAATISISGTVYQSGNEASVFDCSAVNLALRVSVNGAAATVGTCSAVGGTFTISGVDDPAAANIPIAIYTDSTSNPSEKATTITLSSAAATNITGVTLIINRLVLSQESATALTNTHLNTADNGDAGIRYGVSAGALTVDSGMELHVLSGKTFTPGGSVTTTAASTSGNPDGDVHIASSATLSMGTNALSVGGDFNNAGTFSKSSGQTATFTATGTGFTITPNGNNFENLTMNGVGGGWTLAAVTAVDGNLTITNGALTAPSAANLTISGNYSNSGTFTHNSGTVIFNSGSTGKTIAGTMTGGSSFNNVQFNNASGAWSINNSATAAGTFIVTAGSVTHGANTTLTVNGTNFTLASGITWTKTSGTGKIILDHATNLAFADNTASKQNLGVVQIGASPGVVTLTTDMSADTVTIPTTDTFNTKGYDVTTTGAFDCQSGCTLDLTDSAPSNETDGTILDVGGDMTVNSGATFTAATGKVFMNSTSGSDTNRTFITGGKAFHDVELKNAGTTNDDITISGSPFDVNGVLTLTDGQIRLDTNDPNVTTAGNVSLASAATVTKADNGTATWTFDGSGTSTWTDSSAGQDLGLVNINGSSKTINLASSVVATKMIIAASQTLGLGSSGYTLTLTGSGLIPNQPLQNSGTLTEGSNSTVKFTGTSDSDIDPEGFNNLNVSPSGAGSPVYNVDINETGNPLDVTGTFTLGDGTNDVTLNVISFCVMTVGNDVTISASGSFSPSSDGGLYIGGSYLNNGSFTDSGAGVIFTATSTGKTIAGNLTGANKFITLVFDGVGGEWTNTSALETSALFPSNGTFTGSNNVTVFGAVNGTAGVIQRTGGTFTADITTNTTFGPTTASTGWTFNNLTFSTSSGTQLIDTTSNCSTCTYTINGALSVGTKVTLAMQSGTWAITGSLTTTTSGSITSTGSPSVTVHGTAIGGGTGNIMFYNLTKSGAGTTTWTGSGENAVKGTLAISAGTLVAPSGRLVVGTVNQTGGTFTHSSGTILVNSLSNQTFTLTSNANNVTFNDGLVGYWNFDETAGTTAADSSGYGYDGTHTGTPTIDTDVPTVNFTDARSLSFNGTSQYVDIGLPEWLTNQWSDKITLSAWMKPTTLTGDHVIVGQSDNASHNSPYYSWNLFQSASAVCFRVDTTNICSAGSTLTTGWQNIIGVYDGANMYLYHNGTQVATTAKTGNVTTSTQNIRIGARHTTTMAEYFSGKIDDVRIYRRNLGSGEVTAISGGDLGTISASTYTLGAALNVAGNISLIGGTLDVASGSDYAVNVAGNWTNSGGAFTPRSGTVTLNGTASGKTITSRQQAFNHLTMNGSGGAWAIQDATTVTNNLTLSAGTLTGPSGILSVGGDFNNAATYTHNSGTVTMTGTSKNITGSTATPFYNLTISGTTGVDAAGSDISVANLLTVDSAKQLTINTGRTVTLSGTSGTTLSLVGTITGAGRLTYKNTATAFPASGTISSILRMDATSGDQTIGGTNSATRTFGGLVELYSNSTGTAKTITLENGTARTFAFSGSINVIADNTQNLTLSADTATDPTVTVTGDVDYTGTGGGSESITTGSGTWTVSGNIDLTGGTLTATTGNKIVMNGTSKTLTSASQSLYDFEVSGGTVAMSGATTVGRDVILSGGTLTGPSAATVSVGRNWTKTAGSYTANSGTVALTTSTTATISGSTTFYNLTVSSIGAAKTVTTTSGTTQTITGTWTIAGASGQLITIDASTTSQWNVNPTAASIDYADISYTNNQGTAICATHSQSTNGNNTAITVSSGASCGITISGVIRQSSNETSAYDCSANTLTIGVTVNGGTSATADCTLNTGAYSISAANAPSAAGDPIVVYITNGETPIGTTVTLAADTSSNISNLDIIDGRLVLTHENAGPMTNAKLATGDNGNAGIRYSVTTGDVTTESGIEIHVKSGKTYTAGGTVTTNTTGGDLHVLGTATLDTGSNDIGRDITVESGATLNINASTIVRGGDITTVSTGTVATSGTPTVTMRGTGSIGGGSGTISFYNLTIGDGTTATTTLSSDASVSNTLTTGTGSQLSIASSKTLTDSGTSDVSNSGTITGSGTLKFTSATTGGPGTGGTLSSLVRFDASSASIPSAVFDARTYGGAVELYANNGSARSITAAAGAYTFSSTLTTTAGGAGVVTADMSAATGTTTVTGTLTIGATTIFSAPTSLSVGGSFANSGTFTHNSGTLTMSGTGTLTTNGNTLNNFTTTGSGTITFANATHTLAGNLTLGSSNTITPGTSTIVMSGSGKTIDGGGKTIAGLTISGNTTVSNSAILMSGATSVQDGITLSIDSSRSATITSAGSLTLNSTGIISGAGTLVYQPSATFPTGGTISSILRMDATNNNQTMSARTYGGGVEIYNNSATTGTTVTIGTASSQTVTFSSYVYLNARDVSDITFDGTSYNPTVNITGDLNMNGTGGGSEVIAYGDGTWTVSGNVTLAQGFAAPHVTMLNPTWDNVGTEVDEYLEDGGGGCMFQQTTNSCGTSSSSTMNTGIDNTTNGGVACAPGTNYDSRYRAYLKYDLSSISASATVTSVQQQVNVVTAGGAPLIGRAGTDTPNATACGSLYAVGSSADYNSFTDWGTGNHVVSIPATSVQSSIGSTAYALVLHSGDPFTIMTTTDGTAKPILRIGYASTATSPTMIMNGSGVTLTANGAQPAGFYNLTLSGTVTVNSASTVYIAHDFNLSGTVTNNTAALVMTGTGATLSGHGNTIGNMSIFNNATVTVDNSLSLSANLVVYSGATLTIASSQTVTATATVTNNGTITGSGLLTMTGASSGPGTTGTLSVPVRFDATSANIPSTTLDARTYGGAVEFYSNSGSARTVTAPAGTFVFSGAVTTTEAGASTLSVDLNTNDPTVTISGATTIGANTTLSASSSGTFNMNGNYTNNGTFTNNSGTVTLAGASQQTLAGTMTSGSAFHHLTITNNSGSDPDSSPSVIFSASSTMNGTLTAVTANTKLRFAAGITVTPAAINLNGQATGTRITIHSDTPGTQFTFTAGAGARTVSNTSVKDSNACSSTGGSIDASNGTNRDEGNAPCWAINTLSVALSGSSVGLGTLSTATVSQGSVVSTISTSAATGYISLVKYDQSLTAGSTTISNAGGTITNGTAAYGASTSKSGQTLAQTTSSCSSGAGTFNASSLSTTLQSFASASSSASGDATTLCLLATTGATTAPGSYQSTLTIITTAKF